jgi:hypothetical protein
MTPSFAAEGNLPDNQRGDDADNMEENHNERPKQEGSQEEQRWQIAGYDPSNP